MKLPLRKVMSHLSAVLDADDGLIRPSVVSSLRSSRTWLGWASHHEPTIKEGCLIFLLLLVVIMALISVSRA